MKIQLISSTQNAEYHIVKCGRTCYKSDKEETDESVSKFIKTIIKNGHESVLEHASASFRISEVSRALTHQLVRHRLCSFSQQSQRYVKEDQFDYVIPESILCINSIKNEYVSLMKKIQTFYKMAVGYGIKPEDARMVLPNACHTEIVVTANFREWRKIIQLRADSHAQWEIREMAKTVGRQLTELAPNVFDDLKDLIYA